MQLTMLEPSDHTNEVCELCGCEPEMNFTSFIPWGVFTATLCLQCWAADSDSHTVTKLLLQRRDKLVETFDWLNKLPTESDIETPYGKEQADEALYYLLHGKTRSQDEQER